MANTYKTDTKLPFSEVGGALETVQGDELASQRILFGYSITPGDIVHRPEWGAELEEYANAKPTPDNLQRLENQAGRFLDSLPFLEGYSLDVSADGESAVIQTTARTEEGELLLPEVVI
jgi:hypothetical protein